MVINANGSQTGVAVTTRPPDVKSTHPPSPRTTVSSVEIIHSGHNTKTVIVVQDIWANVALAGEFNTVIHLLTEDIHIIQMSTLALPSMKPIQMNLPAAETCQTRFMRLVANVTLTKKSKSIVKHSVLGEAGSVILFARITSEKRLKVAI